MKKLAIVFSLIFSLSLSAQNLKSPAEFLGYELGTQFTRHHEVVDYYQYLASVASDRVQLQEYGKTYERRPLLLACVSSAENLKNLEQIREEHLKNTTGSGNPSKAIVWMSYNVHGNESVSTEASMQTIYDLLTGKAAYLENTVVFIDPCVNPDGRDRYVNWYTENKNSPFNVDPNSKEHHEGWLSGRSNHYMFDLNRDWAWLTQKESQQRLKKYNQWLPHVHVDFHEQSVDNPYYFAPAAEPFHEVITDFQRDFQVVMGKNHARYFDANGWLYFTKEVFDLLYPSYGDTYPMYNGSIGMTYEQGGSGRAGLGITMKIGDTLTLKDRIAHHHTTGLSTVEVASKNAQKLNDEFKKFFANKDYKYKSYVLSGAAGKIDALTELLQQHDIEYGWSNQSVVKGYSYKTQKNTNQKTTSKNLVIQTNQPKGTMVKVLFEPKAKLSDSLTYDITAWSLPYAYGLDAVASETAVDATPAITATENSTHESTISKNTYGYVATWNSMNDARFLSALLKEKIRVRYSKKPFSLDGKNYDRGSLIVLKSDNKQHSDFTNTLKNIAQTQGKTLTPVATGFVNRGKDFGSRDKKMIDAVKVAVLSGGPTSTLRFGEIWHFFEQQLHYPLTVIDAEYINTVNLSKYDVLILPSGDNYYEFMTKERSDALKYWISNGGKLIAMGESISALSDKTGFSIKRKKIKKDSSETISPYQKNQREQIKNAITGAIFKAKVDTTHPLAFGYTDTYFTLKLGANSYDYLDQGNVVYLEKDNNRPVSGFAGSDAQKKIAETLIFGVENKGDGEIIYMVDNPLFRGFWENGKLFFANALFMVN